MTLLKNGLWQTSSVVFVPLLLIAPTVVLVSIGLYKQNTQERMLVNEVTDPRPVALYWFERFDISLDQTEVFLSGEEITNGIVWYLRYLTNLEKLHIDDTGISDDGLVHLDGLTRLRVLTLSNTEITWRGVGHLGDLTKLEQLRFSQTPISDDDVSFLHESLPNCEFIRE